MDEKVKEKLLKQIELIQQMSYHANVQELIDLSKVMSSLIGLLAGSQSSGGASRCHPYVVTLSVEDLADLCAGRVQRMHRQGEAQRTE